VSKSEKTAMGYICLHRSIRDHWIYQDEKKFKWWCDILMECNHSDQKLSIGFQLIECKRGQTVNSLQTWAKMWRVDVGQVRRFFQLLQNDGMVVTENVKKTTRLTVCNYDNYNNRRQANDTQMNLKQIQSEFKTNTNNNVKNDNNVKNEERERYAPHEIEDFKKFNSWVLSNAPRVAEMKFPFTIAQFLEIKELAAPEMVRDVLKAMHNRPDLHKKNLSANLTFRNWLKRETNATHKQSSSGSTSRKSAGAAKLMSILKDNIVAQSTGEYNTAS
jgi:DNA-binding transcriptional regulator YhcF (GntR family)